MLAIRLALSFHFDKGALKTYSTQRCVLYVFNAPFFDTHTQVLKQVDCNVCRFSKLLLFSFSSAVVSKDGSDRLMKRASSWTQVKTTLANSLVLCTVTSRNGVIGYSMYSRNGVIGYSMYSFQTQ